MLKNYLKIALRNLRRHKAYTFINVFGLAVGLACCLLILFYVQDELSYDTYHEKADRIHRLVRSRSAYTAAPMAPALVAEMPRVSHAARIQKFNDVLILNGDEKRFTETVFAADTSLFDIFSFTFVRGHPKRSRSWRSVGPTQDARERSSSIRIRFSEALDARTSCRSVAFSGSRRNASIAARSRFEYR